MAILSASWTSASWWLTLQSLGRRQNKNVWLRKPISFLFEIKQPSYSWWTKRPWQKCGSDCQIKTYATVWNFIDIIHIFQTHWIIVSRITHVLIGSTVGHLNLQIGPMVFPFQSTKTRASSTTLLMESGPSKNAVNHLDLCANFHQVWCFFSKKYVRFKKWWLI